MRVRLFVVVAVLVLASGPGAGLESKVADRPSVSPSEHLARQAFQGGTTSDPCPSAPTRTYEVLALPVPISYNHWGDFDPHGRLFVLESQADDLLANVSSNLGDAGLGSLKDDVDALADAVEDGDVEGAVQAAGGITDEADRLTGNPGDRVDRVVHDALAGDRSGVVDEGRDALADADRRADRNLGRYDVVDLVQPFIVRANLGDCVRFDLTNLLPEPVSLHVHEAVTRPGQGLALGAEAPDLTPTGANRSYVTYIPVLEGMEGAHFLHSHADSRYQTKHGLFGALVAEPVGAEWKRPGDSGEELPSGPDAIIDMPAGRSDFREHVQLYHDEIELLDHTLRPLPTVSPYGEYGPGQKGINLRSEPFLDRFQYVDDAFEDGLVPKAHDKSQGYGSYTFGDPGAYIPESYVGDPTKFRLVSAGPGQYHVHHLHGGGIRWRASPVADDTQFDDGRIKEPTEQGSPTRSESERIDVQNLGPGESYNLEPEGGAGGVQQTVGDLLFHCHIVEHYVAGMWSFWRIYDTEQDHLDELPDRKNGTPEAVDSLQLYQHWNRTGDELPDGRNLTPSSFDAWIEDQLPAQGVPKTDDASVWNWDNSTRAAVAGDPGVARVLGEPETNLSWPNYDDVEDRSYHDRPPPPAGQRPVILWNPENGRPAFPMLRPHLGKRPPFAPGHGPAPYLKEEVTGWRPDGLCPSDAPRRSYDVVALSTDVSYGDEWQVDRDGQIYVRAEDKPEVLQNASKARSLVLRANRGECVDVTLTSQLDPLDAEERERGVHRKVNMHIHLVQFDIQASDGVIVGLNYEQSVRSVSPASDTSEADPSEATTTRVTDPVSVTGDTVRVPVANPDVFRDADGAVKEGTRVGIGLTSRNVTQLVLIGLEGDTAVLRDPDGTFDASIPWDHPANRWIGYEFVNYGWYPDVELGMVYWHDHVDALNSWRHGLFGGLVVEPAGTNWCDPHRDAANGTDCGQRATDHVVDVVDPSDTNRSYREMVVQIQDRGCVDEIECTAGSRFPIEPDPDVEPASFNLKSEPLVGGPDGGEARRNASHPLASWADDPDTGEAQGDPATDTLEAYPGDDTRIRLLYAGQSTSKGVGTFGVTGHRFQVEPKLNGSRTVDRLSLGVSSQHNLRLECGAGGCARQPGDYLYHMTQSDMLRRGAWGIVRVHEPNSSDLLELPSNRDPTVGTVPKTPDRSFDLVALEADVVQNARYGIVEETKLFAFADQAAAVRNGEIRPVPPVVRVHPGETVEFNVTNTLGENVSLAPSLLSAGAGDRGIEVGQTRGTTVAPGETRSYTWHADRDVGVAYFRSFADPIGDAAEGLYGAVVVEPEGATWDDDRGPATTLHWKGRDVAEHVLLYESEDTFFESSTMPYLVDVEGQTSVNYRTAPLHRRVGGPPENTTRVGGMGVHSCQIDADFCGARGSPVDGTSDDGFGARFEVRNPLNPLAYAGTPETPVVRARPGQQVVMRVVGAAGDQLQVHGVDGHWWAQDARMDGCRDADLTGCPSSVRSTHTVGPGETFNAWIPRAGPGGAGDYLWGTHRDPFREDGAWGILRVCPETGGPPSCRASRATRTVREDATDGLGGFWHRLHELGQRVEDTIGDVRDAVEDGDVGELVDTAEQQADELRCGDPVGGDEAPSVMPPMAATPGVPGFTPDCIAVESGGTLVFDNRDDLAFAHAPGSLLGSEKCFSASDDRPGGLMDPGETWRVSFRYDPDVGVEVSFDGGGSWELCEDAVDEDLTTDRRAVIPYQCDVHPDTMLGRLVVLA